MPGNRIRHHKYVATLPAVLESNAVYFVRKGDGFDLHVTNASGTITAYALNVPRIIGAAGALAGAKVFVATVTTTAGGAWTCDLSPAGFTAVPFVQAQAISTSGLLTGAAIANVAGRTAAAANGMVVVPVLGGVLSLGGSGVKVDVLAIGV